MRSFVRRAVSGRTPEDVTIGNDDASIESGRRLVHAVDDPKNGHVRLVSARDTRDSTRAFGDFPTMRARRPRARRDGETFGGTTSIAATSRVSRLHASSRARDVVVSHPS